MRDPFEPVGAWRLAIFAVRALAAAGLALGVGRALVGTVAPSTLPPDGATAAMLALAAAVVLAWVAVPVLALAAAATFGTIFRCSIVDGPALILVAIGWAFAILPVDVPSPAIALAIGAAVAALLTRFLPQPNRLAMLAFLVGAGLLVVTPLVTGFAFPGGMLLALLAVTVLPPMLLASLGPRAGWAHRLALTSGVLPVVAAAAALAEQPAAAALLLSAALLFYAALLLVYWVRFTARLDDSVVVDRPPARVFRELTDLRTPLAPSSRERTLEPLDNRPVGVGSRLRYRPSSGPTETATVTAFEAPAVVAYVVEGEGYRFSFWYGIEPMDGGSRVRWRQGVDVPLNVWIRPGYLRAIRQQHAAYAEGLRAGRRFADDPVSNPASG